MSLLSSLLLLALPSSAPAGGAVLVVDDDGPADHAAIQAAVDASADGDTILVRAGTYAEFEVVGKSLRLVGEPGAVVKKLGTPYALISVRDLAADQGVLLRGIDVAGTVFQTAVGVELRDCAGPVWIEGATVHPGAFLVNSGQFVDGIEANGCASVAVVACDVRAGWTAAGIDVRESVVHVFDSLVAGGIAPSTFSSQEPKLGGPGVRMHGGELLASGTAITGGFGYDGGSFGGGCTHPGMGGDGLVLASGDPVARLLDSTATGGESGHNFFGPICTDPGFPDGQDVEVAAGTLETLPGEARSMASPSPVHEATATTESFRGAPGELVFVGLSAVHDQGPFSTSLAGPLLVASIELVLFKGAVPASGELDLALALPPLLGGTVAYTAFLQPAFASVAPLSLRVGAPTALTIFDAAVPLAPAP